MTKHTLWVLVCEKPEPNDHDVPGNIWLFDNQRLAIEGASTCDAYCSGPHQLYEKEVERPMGTRVTCSCGESFELNSPEEDNHFVWAVRSDGTRSNLGECPITQGSVQAAKDKIIRNGHAWFRGGFEYQGERV